MWTTINDKNQDPPKESFGQEPNHCQIKNCKAEALIRYQILRRSIFLIFSPLFGSWFLMLVPRILGLKETNTCIPAKPSTEFFITEQAKRMIGWRHQLGFITVKCGCLIGIINSKRRTSKYAKPPC